MLKGAAGSITTARQSRRRVERPPGLPVIWMEVLQIGAGLAALAGGIFALWQFEVGREDLRVDRTLRLVERFESEPFLAAQARVAAISVKAREQIRQTEADPGVKDLPADVLATEHGRLIVAAAYETVDGQADLSEAIRQVVGFFGGVSVCVDRKACDHDTAHQFLDAYALEFWRDFQPVVVFERDNHRPDFAREMEAFVEEAKEP